MHCLRNLINTSGTLKITEVVSRMDSTDAFIKGVQGLGFKLKSKVFVINKDETNKMFVMLDFTVYDSNLGGHGPTLKPCLYKRR